MKFLSLLLGSSCLAATAAAQTLPVDPHASGQAGALAVEEVLLGRLVDVHGVHARTGRTLPVPVYRDLLVGTTLPEGAPGLRLETDAVTGEPRLVVLGATPGGADFDRALRPALEAVQSLPTDGRAALRSNGPAVLPRNAALAVRFNDLLDVAVSAEDIVTVDVQGQAHPARVAYDRNHGGEGELGRTGPTRILLDFERAPLPASASTYDANVQLRVSRNARNHAGQGLAADFGWALRSGGSSDPAAGVLPDDTPPVLLGEQQINVLRAQDIDHAKFGTGVFYRVAAQFRVVECVQDPAVGDVLEVGPGAYRVVRVLPDLGPAVVSLIVRNLEPDPVPAGWLEGWGKYVSPFEDGDVPQCFVRSSYLGGSGLIQPQVAFEVRFSEPMEWSSLQTFDSFAISTVPTDPTAPQFVAATIQDHLLDFARFTSYPHQPLNHEQGVSETYYVLLDKGHEPPTDLAGNALTTDLPPVAFQVDADAPSEESGSVNFVFDSADESGDGLPDLRGQFVQQYADGTVSGRPVVRFTGTTERTSPVTSLMTPFVPGVSTPLSPLGSKLMKVWRHIDFGFSTSDETFHNLDVEGLSWGASGPAVLPDAYSEFEIALGHASRFPDEVIGELSNLPEYPDSGLQKGEYAPNVLDDGTGGLQVVHSREKGYAFDASDTFVGPGGGTMVPYPWNSDPDPADDTFFTWRDTAVTGVGAPDGVGLDPGILVTAGLLPAGQEGQEYAAGEVPSIGLPLLMEFSCFPDDTALGLNRHDVSLAVISSAQPNFRLFSTGGIDSQGLTVIKNPDDEAKATGGFNPANGGGKTKGFDGLYYHGTADFLVRVSRAHSVWFDLGAPSSFERISLEPFTSHDSVDVDFRAAVAVPETVANSVADASTYDPYGDPLSDAGWGGELDPVQYLNDDPSWTSSLTELDGARFVQVRITFIGDAVTSEAATLSAFSLSYQAL